MSFYNWSLIYFPTQDTCTFHYATKIPSIVSEIRKWVL